MSIWFTSDEHFGHANVIKFCNRPFHDVDDMAGRLIANHNEVVKAGDLVYHLGDMFWRTWGMERSIDVMKQLNGQHFYIRGNHEEIMDKGGVQGEVLHKRFVWVRDLQRIHPEGYPSIFLCHYAMRVWEKSHQGSWQLYGHSHGELSKGVPKKDDSLFSLDVGVDCWDYYPVHIDVIKQKMEEKGWVAK